MARDPKKPTDAELEILGVIWELGPCTVRQVFQLLSQQKSVGYTSVLKFMQIMVEKDILQRDESVRPQVFKPSSSQKQTQKRLLRDLVERVFSGSPGDLVLQALSSKSTTPEERQKIRELLDRLEEGKS